MGCIIVFFYGCLKLWFPDVEVNPGPRVASQCCRVMFTNINGLHVNRDELAIAATKFDVVACAETKVTGRRHVSELLLPGFKAHTLLLRGARPIWLGMALFVRSGLSVSRRERFECSCCEFMVAKIPGQRLNCYLFVVYQSPITDDRVFDCLCEAMGSIQSVDPKSVFCFVGDFNCHHSELLGSRITDAHGMVALSGLNWRSIFRSPTMVRDYDREVSGIMERFVPMVTVRRRGGDAAWFDGDCRRAFELKQSAYHRQLIISGIMERFVPMVERFVPMVTVRRRGGDAAWFDGDCRRAFELKQSAYHRWCRNRSAEN